MYTSVICLHTDNKSVEPSKPPPLEKMDSTHKLQEKSENGHKQLEKSESGHKQLEKSENGHKQLEKSESGLEKSENGHKQLEKSESGHKLLEKSESEPKLTPVGVDSVIKPLDSGPNKITIGLQTSIDHESQSDHTDSPPPSTPPAATASGVSIHQQSISNHQASDIFHVVLSSLTYFCHYGVLYIFQLIILNDAIL